jgi:hypothetical protein
MSIESEIKTIKEDYRFLDVASCNLVEVDGRFRRAGL